MLDKRYQEKGLLISEEDLVVVNNDRFVTEDDEEKSPINTQN